jgi:sugar phosphate isomerase/epimerase
MSISRRDALRSLAALAVIPSAAAVIPSRVPAQRALRNLLLGTPEADSSRPSGARNDKLDRVGLALITLRQLVGNDLDATLAGAAQIGYRDLDMYIYESQRPASETRAALDRAGLTCRSARIASPALYRGLDRTLDAANTLGARWLTLAWVPWEERHEWADWPELADTFNKVAAAAQKRGITFCYHNHDFELQPLAGKVPFDYLLGATDPSLVKLQMDVYWMTKGARDPASEITRLAGRVATLHLKDMDRTPAGGFTSPGSGTLDFPKILAAARRAGVSDYFVEVDPPLADPLATARAAYQYLANLSF